MGRYYDVNVLGIKYAVRGVSVATQHLWSGQCFTFIEKAAAPVTWILHLAEL